jgi:hypothetical protein
MDQSPPRGVKSHSVKKFSALYGIRRCSQEPATGPNLNQMNLVHNFPPYFS